MLNQYVTWNPKSLMINYSSFYGTRKATNHLFTRKLKTIFFPAFLYCFKNTHITVAQLITPVITLRIPRIKRKMGLRFSSFFFAEKVSKMKKFLVCKISISPHLFSKTQFLGKPELIRQYYISCKIYQPQFLYL